MSQSTSDIPKIICASLLFSQKCAIMCSMSVLHEVQCNLLVCLYDDACRHVGA